MVGAFFVLLVAPTFALYPSSSEVVDLTAANFDRLVLQSDAVWVVEFFAPWCGHCQQLVPEYSKAATALKVTISNHTGSFSQKIHVVCLDHGTNCNL